MVKFTYFDVGGVALQDFTGSNWGEEISTKIRFGKFGSLYHLWNVLHKKFSVMFPEMYKKYILGRIENLSQNNTIWPVINEISKTSKIGLLTNMYPHLFEEIEKNNLLPKVDWNYIIDSSVEGYEKPDINLFRIAEERCGFKGREILFIDNTKQNVDAAIRYGWNGFWYDPNNCEESSRKLFEYYKTL